MLDHDRIRALIPHQGAMCLIDAVLDCGESRITCCTARHRDPENPLRRNGQLGAVCGLEFAAQAIAAHAALAAGSGQPPKGGYLVSVRDLDCRIARLDLLAEPLLIMAERVAAEGRGALYRFAIRAGEIEAVTGRAAVVLEGGAP